MPLAYIDLALPGQITGIHRNEDGILVITGVGEPAETVEMEMSENLQDWTGTGFISTDDSGAFTHLEPAPPGPSSRFYRIAR